MTKEQVRTRYFAAYLGCKIKVDYPSSNFPQYAICDFKHIQKLHDKTDSLDTNWKWNKVILRPLSAITDEHAVMVCGLFGYDVSYKGSVTSCAIVNFGKEFKIEIGTSAYKFMFIHDVADLLRSLGYHTGTFMGYDPIQEGWAVLTDKKDTI
jgi:hypothetical protein